LAIVIKTAEELDKMRQAGRIVATVLLGLKARVRPGVCTAELDEYAEREVAGLGAIPSFKGYNGYPASVCTSINDEVVHGIPSRDRTLKSGDIVSLDFGAIYQGWQGDAAITVGVGKISEQAQRLIEVTEQALREGEAQARSGNRLSDISWAIQSYVESRGFSVVREYVGHGIGRRMHEEPQIPNFGPPHRGPVLKAGMTLALEPMVNAGDYRTQVQADGWTVVTKDNSLSAHFENTVAVGESGPDILTRL
jgi:methionyl aminopeptidase